MAFSPITRRGPPPVQRDRIGAAVTAAEIYQVAGTRLRNSLILSSPFPDDPARCVTRALLLGSVRAIRSTTVTSNPAGNTQIARRRQPGPLHPWTVPGLVDTCGRDCSS